MPNPGGPYLGCATCKRRKIKCDGGKPGCARCRKYGSSCPGYPLEQDARFRYQAVRGVGKQSIPSKTFITIDEPEHSFWSGYSNTYTHSLPAADIGNFSLLPISPPISEDIFLTEVFFEQSVMPVGWYAFLPELYHQAPADGCIRVTLVAAARFLAAHQLDDPILLHRAQRSYGAALRAVNSAIADPAKSMYDETLASILLLNVLDDVVGASSFVSRSHLNGCAHLIKLRAAKGIHTKCSRDLANSIVIQAQPPVMQGLSIEADFFDEKECINDWLVRSSEPSPAADVAVLSLRVCHASRAMRGAVAEDSSTPEYVSRLIVEIEDGMRVERDMVKWYKRQDARWTKKSAVVKGQSNSPVDFYSDMQVAKVWNYWRVARMLLHTALLEVIARIRELGCSFGNSLEVLCGNSLIIIERMLSDITASIPYHFQQIDEKGRPTTQVRQRALGARAVMWPLKMVLSSTFSSTHHRHEAVKGLHFIGDVIGVKQAVVYLREALELAI